MIKQVKTEKRSASTMAKSAAFVMGFNEARKGKALRYEAFHDTNAQWNYERGRLFALVYHGALKNGRKLTWGAEYALQDAIRLRYIF